MAAGDFFQGNPEWGDVANKLSPGMSAAFKYGRLVLPQLAGVIPGAAQAVGVQNGGALRQGVVTLAGQPWAQRAVGGIPSDRPQAVDPADAAAYAVQQAQMKAPGAAKNPAVPAAPALPTAPAAPSAPVLAAPTQPQSWTETQAGIFRRGNSFTNIDPATGAPTAVSQTPVAGTPAAAGISPTALMQENPGAASVRFREAAANAVAGGSLQDLLTAKYLTNLYHIAGGEESEAVNAANTAQRNQNEVALGQMQNATHRYGIDTTAATQQGLGLLGLYPHIPAIQRAQYENKILAGGDPAGLARLQQLKTAQAVPEVKMIAEPFGRGFMQYDVHSGANKFIPTPDVSGKAKAKPVGLDENIQAAIRAAPIGKPFALPNGVMAIKNADGTAEPVE